MKNTIKKYNERYDNLPTLKRDIVFLIFIFGSLLAAQYFTYVEGYIWSLPIWVTFWSLLRIPYILLYRK